MSIFSVRFNSQDIQQSSFSLRHHAELSAFEIHPMQDSELNEAAEVLGQAFFSNPMQMAIYQGHNQKTADCIKHNFFQVLSDRNSQTFVATSRSSETQNSPSIIGLYRTKHCIGRPFCQLHSLSPNLQSLTIHEREQSWHESWASHDPMPQHSHLGPIGVLPSFQRQGVGKLLLQHYCHRLDHQGVSAYLEADKWKNVGLYERFGFQVIEQANILGIPNYFMWRNAMARETI